MKEELEATHSEKITSYEICCIYVLRKRMIILLLRYVYYIFDMT